MRGCRGGGYRRDGSSLLDPKTAVPTRLGAAANTVTARFTRPDQVASRITFLTSDLAAHITGADVTIDGGLITML